MIIPFYYKKSNNLVMNNFSIAQEAAATAADSQGSSMREQAKYADSLQGRINRLDTAWNKLTLSAGSAVMTDGIISVVESLNDLATLSAAVVDKVGVLSGVFGVLGATTVLLSTRFRTFAASLIFGTAGMTRAQLATAGLTAGMGRLGIATIGASTALRGLAAATGVGLIFVGIGFAIEKLIGLYSEAKQKQEEFEQSQEKNIEALTSNKAQTEELIATYKKLSAEKENGQWNTDKEKEYLKIQQQLGEVYPGLIQGISATGEYRIKSVDSIDKEIQATKELLELKKEETKLNALKTFEDNIDERDGFFGLEREVKQKRKQVEQLIAYEAKGTVINQAKQELLALENEFAQTSMKINDEVLKVADAYNKLELDPTIKQSVQDFVASLDLTKLDASELEAFSMKVASLSDQMQKALEKDNSAGFEKAKSSLKQYAKELGASDLQASSLNVTLKDVTEQIERAENATYAGSEGMDTFADASLDAAESQVELSSAAEKLAGTSSKQLDSIYELIGTYKALSALEADNTTKSAELLSVTDQLAAVYPHLVKNKQINIETIEQEAKSSEILLTAVESLTQGKLTKEQQQTTVTALQAKKRIDILKQELAAQQAIVQKFNEMSKTLADNAMGLEQEKLASKAYDRARRLTSDIDIQLPDFNAQIDALGTVIDYRGREAEAIDKQSKATEKASKEYSNSTYVSDKFKQSLDNVNSALEKQRLIQEKTAKHSKQYQTALKNEISLLDQKKTLLEAQAKSLDAQIRSGNIQQTGILTTKSTVSSSVPVSTAATNSYASGGSSAATIWNFFKSKGFSDSIVAGIMGNLKLESGLNPNAINKSSGATGIAQWLGGRKTNLSNFAKQSGTSMYDLNTQLNFLWKELNGSERRTMSYLQGAGNKSAAEVARMFDVLFERSEGTHIPQRQAYANQYLSQFAGKSGSVPVSVSTSSTDPLEAASEASRIAAENAQNIDQARSDLLQLRSDSMSVQAEIERLQLELIKTPLYQAENRFRQIDSNMKIIDARMSKQDETSKAYRTELENQVILLKEKKKLTEQNMVYIENELKKNKNLTQIQRDELQQTYLDLRDSLVDLDNSIVDNRNSFLNSALDGLNKRLDEANQKYTDQIQIIEHLMAVSNGNESEQNKLQTQKLSLLAKQRKEIQNNIKLLESQNKNLANSKDALEKNKQETQKWKEALMGVETSIQGIYADLADKVIQAQKDYYQERLNAELDALDERDKAIQDSYDKERKAMEDNHKRQIELLDKELKAYQDAINQRLRMIDDLDSERDYNKELEKLSAEKLKLEAERNKLSLDTSFEGNARRLEIEEQLKDKLEQIEELKYQREISLRKQSLQDDLDQKTEEIENAKDALGEKQEAEQEQLEQSHRALTDKLEADKKAIQRHYDNIINDERKWAKIREDIMKGNLTNLSSELVGFSNDVALNMSHMGDSIKNNLIDRLKEAIDLMKQVSSAGVGGFQSGISNPTTPTSPSTGGGSSGGSTKPSTPTMWNGLEFKSGQIGMIEVNKAINLWKRVNGKLVEERILKPGEKFRVYGYDSAYGGQYDVGGGMWVTNMPSHIKYMTPSKDLLDKYHDGGIVGGKGNRLTEMANKLFNVGQGEQVIKSLQGELQIPPKNIPNIFKNISNLVGTLSPSGSTGGTIVNLGGIHIANMNGTQKDADSLMKQVTNTLKGKGVIIR
ncbi:phage tail tip lysozyme [Bacillus infantis]|uniref:phage tail tip lysozyme n=1 Tax=Bacillus infantis TaxID=324767 RepID=UPI00209EA88D|nr:phage tail tip lysozyme [Bacillus infantis]MCP1159457.1 phage tail tip lysozyme [Bacillus infantis]